MLWGGRLLLFAMVQVVQQEQEGAVQVQHFALAQGVLFVLLV